MRLLLELTACAVTLIVGLVVGSTYLQSEAILYRMYDISCTEYIDGAPFKGWSGVGLGYTESHDEIRFWREDTGNKVTFPADTSSCVAVPLHQKSTLPKRKY